MIIKKQNNLLLKPIKDTSNEEVSFVETSEKSISINVLENTDNIFFNKPLKLKPEIALIEHAVIDWKSSYEEETDENSFIPTLTFLSLSFISVFFLLSSKLNEAQGLSSFSIPVFYSFLIISIFTFLSHLVSNSKSRQDETDKFHRVFNFLNNNNNYTSKLFSLDIKKFWMEHVDWFLKNTSQKSFYFDGHFIDSKNLFHYISKNYGKASSNSWIFSILTQPNQLFLNRIKGDSHEN